MTDNRSDEDVGIDVALVERLIARQFPEWEDLPVTPVARSGWDNRTFRLGKSMSVRLPSADRYAMKVAIEHAWLPRLAPRLPLPIPTPLKLGRPGEGYPWAWSVYGWIDGEDADVGRIDDPVRFAIDLANFLAALQSIDTTDAPDPGPHNFHRGGQVATYDGETRECLTVLGEVVDVDAVREVWERGLATTWNGPPVWIHGDVAPGNLLVRDGRLCGVVDFGGTAIGDPACDTVIAWTFLEGESREAFRERLALDAPTWYRGRAWALWKALLLLREHHGRNEQAAARARRVVDELLDDSR